MHRVTHEEAFLDLAEAARDFTRPIPANRIPAEPMSPATAKRLVQSELALDGNPALNLASFVTTWMDEEADQLAVGVLNKNLVDKDEYPETEKIHGRVISMMGQMLNAPRGGRPVGTATVGSSEAIMLGLLAHKWAWRRRREAAGAPTDRPNVVMTAAVHTCWEKACRYFDLEPRVVPVSEGRYTLSAEQVEPLVDERTVAVGCVLGNTFTGGLDDIAGISALLDRVHEQHGWDVPIHVDAASGGFVAAFAEPELEWDFRVPRVRSINVSNHKFGLVYAGMGSVVFRDEDVVDPELIFHITYLGGDSPTYSLNFSQSSIGVILQYWNFLRLGRAGYEVVMKSACKNARWIEDRLRADGRFELLDEDSFMPVIALRSIGAKPLDVYAVSDRLRERGWIVPAYPLPPDASDISVLRIVVREAISRDKLEMLHDDLKAAIAQIEHRAPRRPRGHPIC